jgi:hypothetical protein
VVGHAALKQCAARPDGAFAVALAWHILRSTVSPEDRELFHIGSVGTPTRREHKKLGDGDSDHRPSSCDHPSLSWDCVFCSNCRIFEGGRPHLFDHLDTCSICGCRLASSPEDREAVLAMVDKHLL